MSRTKTQKQLNHTERRLLFLVAILCLAVTSTWLSLHPNGILSYYILQKKLSTVRTENSQLKEENEKLRFKLKKIENDPSYLEEIARKDYDLLKKNEIIFEFN